MKAHNRISLIENHDYAMSLKEIGTRLGVDHKAISMTLTKAIRKLRARPEDFVQFRKLVQTSAQMRAERTQVEFSLTDRRNA